MSHEVFAWLLLFRLAIYWGLQGQIFAAQINWNFHWELIFVVSFIFEAAGHQQRRKLLFWVNQQSILLRQFSQWQVWHVPQRLEKYWLNLLLFCFACSKLRLLFLNANIKIKVLFTPNVWCTVSSTTSGLKGIFEYIHLMGLNFCGCKFCWCFFSSGIYCRTSSTICKMCKN